MYQPEAKLVAVELTFVHDAGPVGLIYCDILHQLWETRSNGSKEALGRWSSWCNHHDWRRNTEFHVHIKEKVLGIV